MKTPKLGLTPKMHKLDPKHKPLLHFENENGTEKFELKLSDIDNDNGTKNTFNGIISGISKEMLIEDLGFKLFFRPSEFEMDIFGKEDATKILHWTWNGKGICVIRDTCVNEKERYPDVNVGFLYINTNFFNAFNSLTMKEDKEDKKLKRLHDRLPIQFYGRLLVHLRENEPFVFVFTDMNKRPILQQATIRMIKGKNGKPKAIIGKVKDFSCNGSAFN